MDDDRIAANGTGPWAKGAQTLQRGLTLLDMIAEKPMSVADLSAGMQLPAPHTRRAVKALVSRGFLSANPDNTFSLGPKLMYLGAVTSNQTDLIHVARALLDRLSGETGLCSFLGRRDGGESVHLHRSPGAQRVAVAAGPGARRLLAETSLGKALLLDDDADEWRLTHASAYGPASPDAFLAAMAKAASAGVVLHLGSAPHLIRSVAAPVRDVSGAIVAAISVAAPAQYLEEAQMVDLAGPVCATAHAISARIGWPGAGAAPAALREDPPGPPAARVRSSARTRLT